MIQVNIHGKLGEEIGSDWNLEINSVAEAFRAIEANTRKLRKWIIENSNEYEYEILINKENLFSEQPTFSTLEEIHKSELFMNLDNKIQTIDIIPRIQGSGDVWKIITGGAAVVSAIVVGVFYPPLLPLAVGIGIAGLGLIAAGTAGLLSKPPPNVPFTAQQTNPMDGDGGGEAGGPISYLFNGPVNTVGEGGAVPIGYGELMVGGNNVFANYNVIYRTYKTQVSTTTQQENLQGDNQYLFDSRCFLIRQTPILDQPN
jgi:predicted phage tail protein